MGLELFWASDPVELFFLHIQGSARLDLEGGDVTRISYAAKSGHPFTPIGRFLLEAGELAPSDVSMQSIKAWLRANPDRAFEVMERNRSYIFFQENAALDPAGGPVGAGKVQLTARRSLAVDKSIHTFGTPIFVKTSSAIAGEAKPWTRLMIAQDTGSAIVGEQRGDLFLESGAVAGGVNVNAEFIVLVPNIQHSGRTAG